jgi:thiamine biosynthesis lipoprotein
MTSQYVISFRAMGSQFNAWLETPADGEAILRRVPAWVEAIEARLSRFRPESELSCLNTRSGQWVAVSDTLFQAVMKARHAAQITAGLVNPLVLPALIAAGYARSFVDMTRRDDRLPEQVSGPVIVPDWRGIEIRPNRNAIRLPAGSQIDLGGTAKGWTAAQIAGRLSVYGPCLVDAGGDLAARGKPRGQMGWQVDVAEPGQSDQAPPVASVMVTDLAVATSGIDYRCWVRNGKRQHHLIDPRTGQPAVTDVLSATVIHPDACLAEGYAKALVLLGSTAGLEWILGHPQRAALVVRTDGAVLATADFQSHMVALPAIQSSRR